MKGAIERAIPTDGDVETTEIKRNVPPPTDSFQNRLTIVDKNVEKQRSQNELTIDLTLTSASSYPCRIRAGTYRWTTVAFNQAE